MSKVFISYRRSDSEGQAGRLYRDLIQAFGKRRIVMDVQLNHKGQDYRKTIEQQVDDCVVLLAIIGKSWLTARTDEGIRRLDAPDDLVRREIFLALKKNIPVIPVLVGGAAMPRDTELPTDIKALAFRDGIELTHLRWDFETQSLIKVLKPILAQSSKLRISLKRPFAYVSLAIVAGVLAFAALLELGLNSSTGRPNSAVVEHAATRLSRLSVNAVGVMDDFVSRIESEPRLSLETLIIVSQAYESESVEDNKDLASARAEAVKSYLVAKGLPEARIYVTSKTAISGEPNLIQGEAVLSGTDANGKAISKTLAIPPLRF